MAAVVDADGRDGLLAFLPVVAAQVQILARAWAHRPGNFVRAGRTQNNGEPP
jgi:hypothetical protein